MPTNWGQNVELNKELQAKTNYPGDFGGGEFNEWIAGQPADVRGQAAGVAERYGSTPGWDVPTPETQNLGQNVELNRQLAQETGYTGDFGGGSFNEWMANQPPSVRSDAAGIAARYGSIPGWNVPEFRMQDAVLGPQYEGMPIQEQPVMRTVEPEETVAYQLGQVLDENSPVIQAARTQGLQAAQAAGFLDSTRGRSIGEYAAMQMAFNVASADANTYANNAAANQNWANQFGMRELDGQIQSQLQAERYGHESTLRSQLMSLDRDIRADLLEIEAQYKNQLQTSASAATLYSQAMGAITEILNNPEIPYKQPHIDRQIELLNNGLSLFADIGDLDLIVSGTGTDTGQNTAPTEPSGSPQNLQPFGEEGSVGERRYYQGIRYRWDGSAWKREGPLPGDEY